MKHKVPGLDNIANYDTHTMFQRPDTIRDPLYVVTTIFNAPRYRTRWKLYEDFKMMVEASGAILYTAEVAFGHREFAVTEPENPRHLQLRTDTEIWHKEQVLNLLIQKLPQEWQYVATIDADIKFARPDWADETLHQLQHYQVIQMWSEAQDLDPNYQTIHRHNSFVHSWLDGVPLSTETSYYGANPQGGKVIEFHPGFAWAYRREAINALGGFITWAILGAADNHMARSLIGDAERTVHPDIHPVYKDLTMQWQDRAMHYLKKNIGYMPGKIDHYWHGKKVLRFYWDRWKILTEHNFNPYTDLKNDWQGLAQLVVEDSRQEQLRNRLREYFRVRNEDGIDIE